MKARFLERLIMLLAIAMLMGLPGAVVQAAPVPEKQAALSQAQIDGLLYLPYPGSITLLTRDAIYAKVFTMSRLR